MKKILLVDDDGDLADLLARVLTKAGYQLGHADCLERARQVLAAEGPFDVLITDLWLPDADGVEVAAALQVPIVLALTGSSAPADAKRMADAHFAEVLIKPITTQQLLEALARCIRRPS